MPFRIIPDSAFGLAGIPNYNQNRGPAVVAASAHATSVVFRRPDAWSVSIAVSYAQSSLMGP
jgi:hypothetical protein